MQFQNLQNSPVGTRLNRTLNKKRIRPRTAWQIPTSSPSNHSKAGTSHPEGDLITIRHPLLCDGEVPSVLSRHLFEELCKLVSCPGCPFPNNKKNFPQLSQNATPSMGLLFGSLFLHTLRCTRPQLR